MYALLVPNSCGKKERKGTHSIGTGVLYNFDIHAADMDKREAKAKLWSTRTKA